MNWCAFQERYVSRGKKKQRAYFATCYNQQLCFCECCMFKKKTFSSSCRLNFSKKYPVLCQSKKSELFSRQSGIFVSCWI